jgi:hypothetical protein
MELLPPAFAAMALYPQFIIYKLAPDQKTPGKNTKIPLDFRTGNAVDPTDPAAWTDSSTALAAASLFGVGYGIGFVFTQLDPFWFLDIDNCYDAVSSSWSDLSLIFINKFSQAAVEVSQSGKGLHIFGSGKPPIHGTRYTDPLTKKKLEFYSHSRFVALTGIGARGDAATDYTVELPWLVENYFPGKSQTPNTTLINGPHPDWNGPTDDTVLIERALRKSGFPGEVTFRDLWESNLTVLEPKYAGDESSYDAALAQHLCFWTGNDADRIETLMKQSALVRDKWDRPDYLPRTIRNACSRQTAFLQDKKLQLADHMQVSTTATPITPQTTPITGVTFLNLEHQNQLFNGCIYICDEHKILTPKGTLLNPDRFKVMYGGYTFMMDPTNEKISRNAWEAFTESRLAERPKADGKCFKPALPAGTIVHEDGRTLANTYTPIDVPRLVGDATLFINHIAKLLPDRRDQDILLAYLAACVQHKGIKFHWAPFIQGVEGNAKSLLTWAVARAVGFRYLHIPRAQELSGKFNSWMYEKIVVGVEDIRVYGAQDETIEILKPMITNERQPIEPKGVDQRTLEVCCNFIINSNHKDGLPKTANDRRFAPLYTAQQTKEDLARDGLTSEYFKRLYGWLDHENGWAIVSEFLHTYEIPGGEMNPANKQIAPLTSTTAEAIEYSQGYVEQEINEAIAQGQLGFKDGWVSSILLDALLIRLKADRRFPLNKRRELLHSLGYDWHPHLPEGRVNNIVMPDSGKPKLFIKKGHLSAALTNSADIARAYSEAQQK